VKSSNNDKTKRSAEVAHDGKVRTVIDERSSLQLKLKTNRNLSKSHLKSDIRKNSRSGSSFNKNNSSDILYTFPKLSDTKPTANTQLTALQNPATNNRAAILKSIAVTSFVPFVFGAMCSIIWLIYTKITINTPSWQTTLPVGLILIIMLVFFLGGALKGWTGLTGRRNTLAMDHIKPSPDTNGNAG